MKKHQPPPGLLSWGNYPPCPQTPTPCFWRSELPATLQALQQRHGTTLAYPRLSPRAVKSNQSPPHL